MADPTADGELPLPDYLGQAVRNYLALGDYLRGVASVLDGAVRPRFAAATAGELVDAYLRSHETEPLFVLIEADIRRVYADPALKRVRPEGGSPKPKTLLGRVAGAVGFGRRDPLPARPPLKTLLVPATTDEKADALRRAFLRLLKEGEPAGRAGGARIASFVRLARFSASNPTRDRKLVDAVFASDPAAGLRLADAVLEGHDLLGLEPHVLQHGAEIAWSIGHDGRAVALAQRFFERERPQSLLAPVAEIGVGAALRSGRVAEAAEFALAWREAEPASPRAALAQAAAAGATDLAGGLALLVDTGAEDGSGAPEASALFAALAGRAGDPDRGERAIRRALAQAVGDRSDLVAELHNLHVRRGRGLGCVDALFSGSGSALRWRQFHPDELVDTGPGSGDGEGGALVSVVLPVRSGGQALRTATGSILAQSHAALELVLADTSGDAGVRRQLALAAAEDRRVRVAGEAFGTRHEAVRAGIAAASGTFVVVAHEGDFWLRDLLAAQLRPMRGGGRPFVCLPLGLSVADDGLVACDRLGRHAEPSFRAALIDREALVRLGGLVPVDEGALMQFAARVALARGSAGVRTLDQILLVAPIAPEDDGLPVTAAEHLRSAVWREASLDRHLDDVRAGHPIDGAADARSSGRERQPAAYPLLPAAG